MNTLGIKPSTLINILNTKLTAMEKGPLDSNASEMKSISIHRTPFIPNAPDRFQMLICWKTGMTQFLSNISNMGIDCPIFGIRFKSPYGRKQVVSGIHLIWGF